MNTDTPFLDGKAVKPSDSKIQVFGDKKPAAPTVKSEKTTTGKAKISGSTPAFTDGAVNPKNCPFENVNVKQPEKKKCEGESCETKTESTTFKFDRIWRELTEADDTLPIGGETDTEDANLEGDSFDDDNGDLDALGDDTTEDEGDDLGGGSAEDFLRSIRDQINDFLGEGAGVGEEDLLDDENTELDTETAPEGEEAAPAPAPVPPTQNESWQRKTALGPKMSDKVPGKLGKKKGGGKLGKGTLKKNVVDGNGKKVPLSKFSPKMSDKVSRLKKGDLF